MNEKELNDIWSVYQSCQEGNVERLQELFATKIEDDTWLHVVFRQQCLSSLVYKTIRKYKSESKSVTGKHKKYYDGEYDVSDASELIYLILIELFITKPDENNCVTIDGITSSYPIVDCESLLKNLSYFVDVALNQRGSIAYLDMCPDIKKDGNSESNEDEEVELSLFDIYAYKKWTHGKKKSLRRRIYADILSQFENNMPTILSLFNTNSVAIFALIKTILECEHTFVSESDDEKMVTQEQLCHIVKEHTGRKIVQNNIPQCFATMKKGIMDYMLFSAKDYRRLFSAEQEEAYRKCSIYNTRKQNFLEYIRNHSEVFYPIVNDESGQYKYDMVNLLQSECDVLSKSEDDILTDIAGCVVSYYQDEEKSRIAEMLKDYEIEDRFAKGKAGRWDTYTNNDYFQIRFYRYVYSTNAAIIKIPHDNLMIIEGVVNYYICDTDEMCAYPVPKGKRKSVRKIKKKIA